MARAATNYAELAGDTSLQAWTAGLEATLAFWEGHGQMALDRIDAALAIAPAGAPRFRLLNIAARSHATLGDASAVRAALAVAAAEREVMEGTRDDLHDVVGGEFTFDDARAAACAGAALLQVGDSENALWQTHQTFALHMSGTAPTSSAVLSGASVDGAAALVLEGDLMGAETYLRPVLELDPDPANASLGGRLRSVADLLDNSPPTASRAKELAAEVKAWLVGPRQQVGVAARLRVLGSSQPPGIGLSRRQALLSASRPRCRRRFPGAAGISDHPARLWSSRRAQTPRATRQSGISDHCRTPASRRAWSVNHRTWASLPVASRQTARKPPKVAEPIRAVTL